MESVEEPGAPSRGRLAGPVAAHGPQAASPDRQRVLCRSDGRRLQAPLPMQETGIGNVALTAELLS
jgi:hypothetical protein